MIKTNQQVYLTNYNGKQNLEKTAKCLFLFVVTDADQHVTQHHEVNILNIQLFDYTKIKCKAYFTQKSSEVYIAYYCRVAIKYQIDPCTKRFEYVRLCCLKEFKNLKTIN